MTQPNSSSARRPPAPTGGRSAFQVFFDKRGISDAVRDARGYTEYAQGKEGIATIVRLHPELAKHTKWLRRFTSEPGILIPKHPVFQHSAPIRPQLRPFDEVAGDPVHHCHATRPKDCRCPRPHPLLSEHALHGVAGRPGHLEKAEWAADHAALSDPLQPHTHVPTAKYGLAPETYATPWGDYAAQDYGGPIREVVNDSIRLDTNPLLNWSDEMPTRRVMFGIEGTPKCDAMVSAGEWAFDVPGVSMWNAPELVILAVTRLRDCPVFVIPDADWATKNEVIYHATNCREYLRSLMIDAHIAAPPSEAWCANHSLAYQKGVDDYLGDGGTIDSLRVLDRDLDEDAFQDFADEYLSRRVARGRWLEGAKFDLQVARAMAMSSRNGEAIRSTGAILRAIHPPRALTVDDAYQASHREPIVPVLGKEIPEWSRYRGVAGLENARRNVHRSLVRLQEAGVFEPLGVLPSWVEGSWKKGRAGKWRYQPGQEQSTGTGYIEVVKLHSALRVIEADGGTVGERS